MWLQLQHEVWSLYRELNPKPRPYQGRALPLELHRHYGDTETVSQSLRSYTIEEVHAIEVHRTLMAGIMVTSPRKDIMRYYKITAPEMERYGRYPEGLVDPAELGSFRTFTELEATNDASVVTVDHHIHQDIVIENIEPSDVPGDCEVFDRTTLLRGFAHVPAVRAADVRVGAGLSEISSITVYAGFDGDDDWKRDFTTQILSGLKSAGVEYPKEYASPDVERTADEELWEAIFLYVPFDYFDARAVLVTNVEVLDTITDDMLA